MEWIDTNLLISICTCAIGLTQFLFWKHIAKQKSYESEKGKNLATKEDIGKITQEIKSVESRYNNALEEYKFELQTFFESSKPIINLCNSLDKKLLELIVECKRNIDNDLIENHGDYTNTINSIYKFGRFFLVYRSRYEENDSIKGIIEITTLLSCIIDTGDINKLSKKQIETQIKKLEEKFKFALAEILPKFTPITIIKPAL